MFETGDRIADRYTVLRALGEGGMGGVYEIRGDALDNRLALKVLHSRLVSDPKALKRFEREARIQANLNHPGIARVFELVETFEGVGIVMEYIHAPTLREVLAAARPAPEVARAIAIEIAEALMAAHEAGVAHRDIKPENIFVWADRMGRQRCKIIDFGIAKRASESHGGATSLTQTGAFIGTFAYASPEQITHEHPIDHRSDLYSLGVVLWEMLAGVEPYRSLSSGYSVQAAVVGEPLPMLPGDVPEDLQRVVIELTRKHPSERPQAASEVVELLASSPSAARQQTQGAMPHPSASSARAASTVQSVPPSASPSVPPSRSATTEQERPSVLPGTPRSPKAAALSDTLGQLVFGAGLQPAPVVRRLDARIRDELVPQLVQLTCIGILAYPILVMSAGLGNGQSKGRARYNLRVYTVNNGEPASSSRMFWRNLYDLCLFQLPLLGITSPLSWVLFPLPLFAGLWLSLALPVECLFSVLDRHNRRLADQILGTVVCREGRS